MRIQTDCMETKQHDTKKLMGKWGNPKGNSQGIFLEMIMKTTIQNLWAVKRTLLRGKFIAIQAFLKKEEKSQIDKLNHQLNELEKEQTKPKVSRRKDNKDQRGNQ